MAHRIRLAMISRFRTFNAIVLLAGLFVAAAPRSAEALPVFPRPDWSVGIAYGLSEGEFDIPDGPQLETEEGATPQIRVTRQLGAHWALGAEYEGWFVEVGNLEDKLRVSMQFFGPSLTWYPGNPANAWSGLYLRGAAGLGYTRVAVVELNEDLEQVGTTAIDDSGPGFLVGAGYEFWITRQATTGLGLSYVSLHPDGQIIQSGWFTPLVVHFNVRF